MGGDLEKERAGPRSGQDTGGTRLALSPRNLDPLSSLLFCSLLLSSPVLSLLVRFSSSLGGPLF